MNFIKRAFLSVKERKIKTFVLMVIFMIIANLILAGFAIQSATKTASDLAIQKLGSDVTLSVDAQKMRQNGLNRQNMPFLTVDTANKLTGLNYVKGYNYISSSVGQSNGFTPVKTDTSNNNTNTNMNKPRISFGGGNPMNADVSLSGVLYTDLLDAFNNGTNKMISGRTLTKEDAGQSVALIEKTLADNNSLKVGGTIQVKSPDGSKNLTLKVVGIYQNTSSQDNTNMGMPVDFLNPANMIYVPYATASQFKNTSSATSGTTIDQAIYYLDSPAHLNAFKAEAAKTNIDFNTYRLDANEALYQQMMGPIENVASFAKIVVYIVAIAGAVILGLIVFLSIKERRQEMGILLSIGERKTKLISQFLVETLMVAILAFGLSILTGNVLSQKIGDVLLQKEISATQQQQNSPRNKMIFIGGPAGMQQMKQNANVKPIDQLDISVTLSDVGKMGGTGLGIVILATLLPTLSVLRLRPKTILSKNE